MTSPVASARPKTARTLAALAATAIVGALSPVVSVAPAAAAPADVACPEGFGATAASNTLALGKVDLRGVGLPGPAVPELRIATTHSGIAGSPARAAAAARYLQSSGNLPTSVLGPRAYQQAPPPQDQPDVVDVAGVDTGALRLEAGALRAQAGWKHADRCGTDGPAATSGARLAGLQLLPGRNGNALARLNAIESATTTGITQVSGKPAATAAANGGISDFQLLAGGPSAIGVRVVSPPSLQVVAGAKKSVDYSAPVLDVTIPGQAPVHLASAGSHFDVVVPVDAASRPAAESLGRTENLPVANGVPLLDLLTGVTSTLSGVVAGGTAVVAPGADLNSILGGLPGLPMVGGLLGGSGPATNTQPATEGTRTHDGGRVVVLRVELGNVEKQNSPDGVYAKATSVHVKLIFRKTGDSGPADQTALVDLGVCTLEAAAAAPRSATPSGGHTGGGDDGGYGGNGNGNGGDDDGGYGHHGGGGTGGTSGGGGGGTGAQHGSLPVTGNNVALFLGGGVLMVVAGRLLQIMARRRRTA